MRIAMLTFEFPGTVTSGVASYTRQCAFTLAESRHEVHVFTFAEPGKHASFEGERLHLHVLADLPRRTADQTILPVAAAILANAGIAGSYMAAAEILCESLRHAHKQTPFDLIEAPEVLAPALPLLVRPIAGVPVVVMLHAGTAIAQKYNEWMPTEDHELLMANEHASILLSDALCAPTRAVVAETRTFFELEQSVAVFPSPVYLDKVCRTPRTSDGTFAMFAGRLEILKGCREFAAAANIFLQKCPDAEIRLYGPDIPVNGNQSMKGWMLEQLTPGLRPRMRFMGCVAPAEIANAYAACRFVVAPSRFENFGTVACEALAAGCPVLYTDGHGLDETVGEAGLRVKRQDIGALADGMQRMWTDSALRTRLVEAGRLQREGMLSNAQAIAKRVDFYKHVIATGQISLGEKMARLAKLPARQMGSILACFSGMAGRLCGAGSAWSDSAGERARSAVEQARRQGNPSQSIWLYGAGKHTRRLLAERARVESATTQIVGVLDDSAGEGTTFCGLPLLAPKVLLEKRASTPSVVDLVLLSSDSIEDVLWHASEPLRKSGIPVHKLYG